MLHFCMTEMDELATLLCWRRFPKCTGISHTSHTSILEPQADIFTKLVSLG